MVCIYMHIECCCRCCCSVICYTDVVAAAAKPLLPAAGRRRVPDGICFAGPFNLILVFSFSSFKHDTFLMYPLAVLSHVRPRCAYILGHYGHAQSQGRHHPAAAKPPLYNIHILISTASWRLGTPPPASRDRSNPVHDGIEQGVPAM